MFELPILVYTYDSLEPYIDAQTMEIHHSKHHQGYVNKLNAAIEGIDELADMTVVELIKNLDKVPEGKKDAVRNNGGGHANHSLFWDILSPDAKQVPDGELLKEIESVFGSLDACKEEVSDAAATQFGSGWGWLVINDEGKLEAVSTQNQNSPYLYGYTPLLGIDVWEHAYYLKYQNKRPEYIEAIWNVIDWTVVEKNYEQART
ncbi:superoxide dismutase [candidate division WWE3 bacterium]|uniref:Superoxide dismutase n=1 Tax=candidate division WWE3 bacterium TaxID=2053526 RepID=A0A955RWV1_UNCKA|nr:superoxide dismutase [candidate division WWE3 bacterium]